MTSPSQNLSVPASLTLENSDIFAVIQTFIEQEKLPGSYLDTAAQWFLPLLGEIRLQLAQQEGSVVVGISGCQGSGKSTLAALLVALSEGVLELNAISLSIDDFYLTHAERQALARDVHPLFATRGVPGTHDVALAINTIRSLASGAEVAVPRFDKSADDRAPEAEWSSVQGPIDVIILEGWCVGIGPQHDTALVEPVNPLEKEEDQQGVWRRHVNEVLREHYLSLYDMMDFLVMLRAPDFDKVFEWRQKQEDKLAQRLAGEGQSLQDTRVMTPEQVRRFIQHYERLTRHGLETLPQQADVVFQLDDQQKIISRR